MIKKLLSRTTDPKIWWKSRTFWVNVLTIGLAATNEFTKTVPPKYSEIAIILVGILNLILRLLTAGPVALK